MIFQAFFKFALDGANGLAILITMNAKQTELHKALERLANEDRLVWKTIYDPVKKQFISVPVMASKHVGPAREADGSKVFLR